MPHPFEISGKVGASKHSSAAERMFQLHPDSLSGIILLPSPGFRGQIRKRGDEVERLFDPFRDPTVPTRGASALTCERTAKQR